MKIESSKILVDLPAHCLMNEGPLDGEGGRVVIHASLDDKAKKKDGFRQVQMILNLGSNEAIRPFPETREGKRRRCFRILLVDEGEIEDDGPST